MSEEDVLRPIRGEMMMEQDQIGAQAEALQAQHDIDVPRRFKFPSRLFAAKKSGLISSLRPVSLNYYFYTLETTPSIDLR